ncbi:hydantoinase B/oxoprolinase family protein [Brevibacillus fluminis]|uniref:Hydantoinase B/oxoprolinase family protein n=1 Tax=Brevibacillus fluminis TaxID=511487 RepID=A0A3M8DA18_9BACL|nr:hydantoinase B/oxoprolinase family protein [Brevibacillus fluminis]RNB84499.1 hydantoinase B/oxoprolinase family protein [Brevibacillus fluminis]
MGETITIAPDLLAILSSKINSISKQMSYTLQRSARSSVISSARDFSTAICDGTGDVVALPNGFPVHVANMSVTAKAIFEFHPPESLAPGDAILNNSPYHGNTHMADHTIIVPVFHEGELMFLCTIRGHQADIGNSIPTTYHATAKDIYEEGALCFPCVKVQKDYEDVTDIIRMAHMRIRVSDVWYGDYLAMIGAARIGERELTKLIEKYGKETIKSFCREWHAYGNRRMAEEIKKLPAGTWYNESQHDPIPGILPDGLLVKVKVTIDPSEAVIEVDFTDNADPIACGLNLCEATVLSAGRTGVLNVIPADLPLCEGTFSRIKVKMRDSGVVGKASLPFSSSMATTNIADRAILAVQCAFNEVSEELGMAEGSVIQPPSLSVISGYDSRYGRSFVTQLISGSTGGMGVNGHDGYIAYCTCNGGMMEWNSIEVIEQKYPIQYLMQEIIEDSGGAGKWDGSPATKVIMKPRKDKVTFIYVCDGKYNPPRGARGGHDGSPANAAMYHVAQGLESKVDLPMFHSIELGPEEALISEISSGGGYGNPYERDPEMVRFRVKEGWVSRQKAKDVYGVVFETEESFRIDYKETEALRKERKGGVNS